MMIRIGQGFDVHQLVEGRPLIIGGVEIPYEKGLLGHSDADVLLHTITDALLGAIGEGDIGKHFPDTLMMERPKMAPHISSIRKKIAEILDVKEEGINVKATTTEKLGFTGRGQGIACMAVVLLTKN